MYNTLHAVTGCEVVLWDLVGKLLGLPRRKILGGGCYTTGLMNLSAGSRSFTRYGYGDLFKEGRKYGILHRIWPGTQRLLLWGDPRISAAHSKSFSFCGSVGVDLMEPCFKQCLI